MSEKDCRYGEIKDHNGNFFVVRKKLIFLILFSIAGTVHSRRRSGNYTTSSPHRRKDIDLIYS